MYMSNFQIGIQDFGFFTKFSYGSNPVELFLNYLSHVNSFSFYQEFECYYFLGVLVE